MGRNGTNGVAGGIRATPRGGARPDPAGTGMVDGLQEIPSSTMPGLEALNVSPQVPDMAGSSLDDLDLSGSHAAPPMQMPVFEPPAPLTPMQPPSTMLEAPEPAQQYAEPPSRVRRYSSTRRGQLMSPIVGMPGTNLPGAPARKSIVQSFGNPGEKVYVFRIKPDGALGAMLPKVFPGEALAEKGLGEGRFHAFLLDHVVPHYGGGNYLIRGYGPGGVPVGEGQAAIEGPEKTPGRSSDNLDPGDPRRLAQAMQMLQVQQPDGTWVNRPVGPANSVDDAMTQVINRVGQAKMLKSLSGDDDGGSPAKLAEAMKAAIAPLAQQVTNLSATVAMNATPPPPVKDPMEALLGFMKFQAEMAPKGPSATELALQRQLDDQRRQIEIAQKAAEDARREAEQARRDAEKKTFELMFQQQNARLEQLTNQIQQQQHQRPPSFKEQIVEVRELAESLGIAGGPSGTTALDVVSQNLSNWTPERIGEMSEKLADSEVKTMMAKAEIERQQKSLGNAAPTQETEATEEPEAKEGPMPYWKEGKIVAREKHAKALLAAKTHSDVLRAFTPIVMGLDEEMFESSIESLKECISYDYENGLLSQAQAICLNIYGEGRYGDLPQRMVSAVLANRKMVCSMLDIPYRKLSEHPDPNAKQLAAEQAKARAKSGTQVEDAAEEEKPEA